MWWRVAYGVYFQAYSPSKVRLNVVKGGGGRGCCESHILASYNSVFKINTQNKLDKEVIFWDTIKIASSASPKKPSFQVRIRSVWWLSCMDRLLLAGMQVHVKICTPDDIRVSFGCKDWNRFQLVPQATSAEGTIDNLAKERLILVRALHPKKGHVRATSSLKSDM